MRGTGQTVHSSMPQNAPVRTVRWWWSSWAWGLADADTPMTTAIPERHLTWIPKPTQSPGLEIEGAGPTFAGG